MKILVTGASGIVGSEIVKKLVAEGHQVTATALKNKPDESGIQYPLANLGDARTAFELIHKYDPEVVVHAASNSNIDLCELYQDQAWVTNVIAVKNLIGLALLFGYRLLFFSSEQVYGEHPDGDRGRFKENDSIDPLSFYAHSKMLAEQDIEQHLENYVIFRLALVYGWGTKFHSNWCDHMYEDLEEGIPCRMYSDQTRSMISTFDIAEAVSKTLSKPDMKGIFNLGGPAVKRDEFAVKFARNWNFPESLIVSATMNDDPPEAPRPSNCSMNISRLEKEIGFSTIPLKDILKRMKDDNPHPPLNR